ncbi:helix-turn-helix domain-containing protein [Leisingera sp. M527]|uniref:helix-turn-helix domain-containing protein n=1 Tax=Leisingera sp. M527 TaxID=2867014 RepID=UPI0021A2B476|nr:helix-turn-helix domain-containing protein [Leisingera sp. M527]UWQ32080.1 helix-turn-helix domain-containing protein [Leisingera sp. M527]
MTDLESFKAVRIQWHKALFASPALTGTEKAIAAYFINVRLNWKTGQINPAVATIARDICVEPRTVQRAVNSLERLGWFHTDRGNGRTRSTNYHVTDESIEISEQIKRQCTGRKDDGAVTLSIVEPWQKRRNEVTSLSQKRRQECHSKSIKKNKRTGSEGAMHKASPVVFVPGGGSVFEREWDDRLAKSGRLELRRLLSEVQHNGRRGYWLPATWPAQFGSSDLHNQIQQIEELALIPSVGRTA